MGHTLAPERPRAALPHTAFLTEKLMEDPGNGAVPLTLEERQPRWGHAVLVFSVEVERAEGPHLEAVAATRHEQES